MSKYPNEMVALPGGVAIRRDTIVGLSVMPAGPWPCIYPPVTVECGPQIVVHIKGWRWPVLREVASVEAGQAWIDAFRESE